MDRASTRLLFLLALMAAGCGTSSGGSADAGTPSAACGLSGPTSGSECHGLDQCGAGMLNFRQVTFCEHCFAFGDTHVCEAGKCRMLTPGTTTNIKAAFIVPAAADGAKSLTIATIDPIMADGTKLSCAALRSSCMIVNNAAINAAASRFRNFSPSASATMAYSELIAADPGDDRLVFLQLVAEVQGRGSVKAVGCTEHVHVTGGQVNEVAVDLSAP